MAVKKSVNEIPLFTEKDELEKLQAQIYIYKGEMSYLLLVELRELFRKIPQMRV